MLFVLVCVCVRVNECLLVFDCVGLLVLFVCVSAYCSVLLLVSVFLLLGVIVGVIGLACSCLCVACLGHSSKLTMLLVASSPVYECL